MCFTSAGNAQMGQSIKNQMGEGQAEVPQTVRQILDARIASVRQHLEELCIQKAKADTAGLLDFPYSFIASL